MSKAQMMFDQIGFGRANAVRCNDRLFRDMVSEANKNGDCIVNVGFGYFRPDPTDEKDNEIVSHYLAQELHRAREIQHKRLQMKQAFLKSGGKIVEHRDEQD